MTDSTNNSFEEQWQHAFDNAELTPPESVWEKIELGLNPEHTLPSKPNFGNKSYYFFGGLVVGILGIFLWFSNVKEKSQILEKEVVINKKSTIKIEKEEAVILAEKKEIISEIHSKKLPTITSEKSKEITLFPEIPIAETKENDEEVPIRTLTDSVEMIEPLTTKSILSGIENPTINLPTDQTPYYVKPIPKSQKKSILKNVKISVGAGVYQQ
jgi:hypothetical protein